MPFLEVHKVAIATGLEADRAVRRCGSSAELARLRDRAARELRAADPGRKAEKVLDAAGVSSLASESCALDHERVESFGGAVDGRAEPCRATADDQKVDFLPWRQLTADPERP